jgi:dienelactone hydrolase
MHVRTPLAALALWTLLISPAPVRAEPMDVKIPTHASVGTLDAWLALPDTTDPAPAIVFLHGCSGLTFMQAVLPIYDAWTRILNDAGFAVLQIDSAGSRGIRNSCGPGESRATMYRERPGDAYASLSYLQGRPGIDPERIYLMGWSQGGGIALLTMNTESIGRPDRPPAHDFRGAIAFYPGKCARQFHVSPFTTVEPGTWTTIGPILVLQGGRDTWTPAAPCVTFVRELQARGEPVDIIVYPDAVHSFDAPGLPLRQRIGVSNSRGQAPLVGTDENARRAAIKAVLHFLDEHR